MQKKCGSGTALAGPARQRYRCWDAWENPKSLTTSKRLSSRKEKSCTNKWSSCYWVHLSELFCWTNLHQGLATLVRFCSLALCTWLLYRLEATTQSSTGSSLSHRNLMYSLYSLLCGTHSQFSFPLIRLFLYVWAVWFSCSCLKVQVAGPKLVLKHYVPGIFCWVQCIPRHSHLLASLTRWDARLVSFALVLLIAVSILVRHSLGHRFCVYAVLLSTVCHTYLMARVRAAQCAPATLISSLLSTCDEMPTLSYNSEKQFS